jgi:hypothetical protein
MREELRVDYGKIDYAIDVDDTPVLFDVNKTTGNRNPNSEWGLKMASILAQGLDSLVMRGHERSGAFIIWRVRRIAG